MKIARAQKTQANDIAKLIMEAMNYDCCRYFTGENYTLDDFEEMMTFLVSQEGTQYSYENSIVAVSDEGTVIGVCVSYDGARLRELRKAFISETMRRFGRDFSNMDDETSAGEIYLDTLCVNKDYRHQGIASALILASLGKAIALNFTAVGLLVDLANPKAETLYKSLGFKYVEDTSWGGHPMHHMQYPL